MKIAKVIDKQHILARVGNDPEVYDVQSPRGAVTLIDRTEVIQDYFPYITLTYTIEEAEELLENMKTVFPDYADDPYYHQGKPLYPIYAHINQIRKPEKHRLSPYITIYRYKVAGEWIYGVTNKWTDSEDKPYRTVEAAMDGWEKWLRDRKQMIKDKWIADYEGNLDM